MSAGDELDGELFRADDLCRASPDLAEVASADRRAEIDGVARLYFGADEARRAALDVKAIATSSTINDSYVLTAAKAGGDRFVLKRRGGDGSAAFLEREAAYLARLAEGGVPVPPLVRSREAAPVVRHADAAWLVTRHVSGTHFHGGGNALASIADGFVSLVEALRGGGAPAPESASPPTFFTELGDLLHAAKTASRLPPEIRELLERHAPRLLAERDAVASARRDVEAPVTTAHLDLHPMNVLVDGDRLAAILDMEDIADAPLPLAVGFSAYKLVRRAMTDPVVRAREERDPSLVPRWVARWTRSALGANLTREVLGLGARYRELYLVHYLLARHLRDDTFREPAELRKHLLSFHEIDIIFGPLGLPPRRVSCVQGTTDHT